jgi:hypothetical protein
MGLDNYWMKNKEEAGHIEGDFNVWGGMMSGSGNKSFRGKVYNAIVEEITDVSLYGDPETNEIPNETVKQMADKLDVFDFSTVSTNYYSLSEEDYDEFKKMFRLHADAGHFLVSSW